MLLPSVVVDGQIVGVWRRTIKKGAVQVKVTLFSGMTKAGIRAVEAVADRYGRFVG